MISRAPVYRGYTQAELDIQYNQAALVPELAPYVAHWAEATEAAQRRLTCERDIAYGSSERELLDVYRPAKPGSPVVINVHGGAWRLLSKDQSGFGAVPMVEAGAGFVALGFELVESVGLVEMVRQVRAGVAWVYRHGAEYGLDPKRIYLHGFSSGAHLAACVLADGWRAEAGLPEDLIKGAVLASGPYDLEPVLLSARSSYLNLNPAEAPAINPMLHIPTKGPPAFFAWGSGEHTEFRRQSVDFAAAWQAAGNVCETQELVGLNHFDVCNTFGEPNSAFCRAALAQMEIE